MLPGCQTESTSECATTSPHDPGAAQLPWLPLCPTRRRSSSPWERKGELRQPLDAASQRDEPRASRETRVGRRPDAVHRPTQLVARLSAVQFDGEGDKAASRDAAKQVSARFATTDEHDEQLLARRCWEATLPVHPQLGPSVGTGLGLRRD